MNTLRTFGEGWVLAGIVLLVACLVTCEAVIVGGQS